MPPSGARSARRPGLTVLAGYAGFDGVELTDQTGDQVYVCTRA